VTKGKAQMRYFFLFSDMMLYTKRKGKKYEYKGHFSFSKTLLIDLPEHRSTFVNSICFCG